MPGSVSAMMRAAGFTSEKDFFKAVEAGQIMANDVLPNFAKELKKVASSNGALDAVTKKTRAEFNRFINSLTMAKDVIFGNGMDEGLAYMFGEFSDTIKDNQGSLKAFGQTMKAFFVGITNVISPIIKVLGSFGTMIYNLFGNQGTYYVAMAAGTGFMLWRLGALVKMFKELKVGTDAWTVSLLRNPIILAGVATGFVTEDVITGARGGDAFSSSFFNTYSKNALTQANEAGWLQKLVSGPMHYLKEPLVNAIKISWNQPEAEKLFTATIEKTQAQQNANMIEENQ